MTTLLQDDLTGLDKAYRTALINCLSGAKSANLIATRSEEGQENLALFSSVIHLGANPALLGFIMRPVHAERHTYLYAKQTGVFTVNAVSVAFQERAHQASARYAKSVSEFDACGLTPEYLGGFAAPYVKESPLRMACELTDDIEIKTNGTRLLVGRITAIHLGDGLLRDDGSLDLAKAGIAAITGLDTWHPLVEGERFAYAKPNQKTRKLTP